MHKSLDRNVSNFMEPGIGLSLFDRSSRVLVKAIQLFVSCSSLFLREGERLSTYYAIDLLGVNESCLRLEVFTLGELPIA